MAKYVCLVTFTDAGVRNLRKTTVRSRAFRKRMEAKGIRFLNTLWTVGTIDLVHVFEAENDEVAATLAFTLSALGNVRTNTMRAFDADEMEAILEKVETP